MDVQSGSLEVGHIVAIVCAGVFFLVLMAVGSLCVVYVYHRNMLCFRRRRISKRPHIYSQGDLEKGLQRKRRLKGLNRPPSSSHKRRSSRADGHVHHKKKRLPFEEDHNTILENPMADPDLERTDFSNPMFDHKKARLRDAAILIQSWYRMWRHRIPFLQQKEAAAIIQSVWRGYMVRKRLPQYQKEKKERIQQRKKTPGFLKKKGTLAQLKFYDVKAFGYAIVEQLYGLETIRQAAELLKAQYGSRDKMRLKLFISAKGLKLFDTYSMQHYATVNITSVSFCTMDPRDRRLFAFINRKRRKNFCHVFHTLKEGDAHKMVETLAEAFEIRFKQLRVEKEAEEKRKRNLLAKRRVPSGQTPSFHGSVATSLAELDSEVGYMMHLASNENTPRLKPSNKQLRQVAEIHPTTQDAWSSGSASQPSLNSAEDAVLIKPQHTRLGMVTNKRQSTGHSPLVLHNRTSLNRTGSGFINIAAEDYDEDVEENTVL